MEKRWIRLYTKIPISPKVQRLPGDLFKFWVNCLCFAGLNDGALPSVEDIAWTLHMPESDAQTQLELLADKRLAENRDGWWFIHDWDDHQYDSDSSTERQRRYRQRQRQRRAKTTAKPPETSRVTSYVTSHETSRVTKGDVLEQNRIEEISSSSTSKRSPIEQAGHSENVALACLPARSPENANTNANASSSNGHHRKPDFLTEVWNKATAGLDLPPPYIQNAYGRRERNPAAVALANAYENASDRIRRSRKPVAYARSLIERELKGG